MRITEISSICLLLVTISVAKPAPGPEGASTNPVDSYSNIPIPDQSDDIPQDSPLALELIPPSVVASAAPHIYYMGSDGIAVPAEVTEGFRRLIRKREVAPEAVNNDETMATDETIIIGPPSGSGRYFGVPALRLGYRPARAYYARRYHKYPWNYH